MIRRKRYIRDIRIRENDFMQSYLKFIVTVMLTSLLAAVAHGSIATTFVASDDPALAPDAASGANVWTFSSSGNGNSFFGNSSFGQSWGINSGGSTVSDIAEIEADIASLVGTTIVNQGSTISLDFDNGGIGSNGVVGVRFLNASGIQTELTLRRFGEYQVDGVDTGVAGTTSGVNLQVVLTDNTGGFNFLIDGSVVESGTFANGAGIERIQVFANRAGSFTTDVFTNNLQIKAVPEPLTLITFSVGLSLMLRRRR